MSIYKDALLEHYKNPKNFGKLKGAEKVVSVSNRSCGDEITMSLILRDNEVQQIKFSGKGCVISIATASLLTEYCQGKKIDHLLKLNERFILSLIKIPLGPVRLRCALLSLEALKKGLLI